MTRTPRRPFATGSVSLGIYVHDGEPRAMVDTLMAQAAEADGNGFDGVTLSEHHAGCATYVPSPLLCASWLLDTMATAWSGPFPLLLPLRAPGLVVEELAWLQARHPGRVAAAFASGYLEKDFAACGVRFDDRNTRFRELLGVVGRELSTPSALFAEDPVVKAASGAIPLAVAARGPRAVALAAGRGFGISVPLHDPATVAGVHANYLDAGGTGPRIRMRWVWLGSFPDTGKDQRWPTGTPIDLTMADDPQTLAEELLEDLRVSNSTCLSVRIHRPGISPEAITEQIGLIGRQVVPRLHRALQL